MADNRLETLLRRREVNLKWNEIRLKKRLPNREGVSLLSLESVILLKEISLKMPRIPLLGVILAPDS